MRRTLILSKAPDRNVLKPDRTSHLATEARPLNELLEKTRKWKWTDQCDAAFENIKKLVTSDQVLTHYDPAHTEGLFVYLCIISLGFA
jgi:hypothetical protein